jgi:hypothetical protein
MPSVVRVAEQRVGRIDRMDSLHRDIESWWPRDAHEFALAADERLTARLEAAVDALTEAARVAGKPRMRRDLSDIAESWMADKTTESALADQHRWRDSVNGESVLSFSRV